MEVFTRITVDIATEAAALGTAAGGQAATVEGGIILAQVAMAAATVEAAAEGIATGVLEIFLADRFACVIIECSNVFGNGRQ